MYRKLNSVHPASLVASFLSLLLLYRRSSWSGHCCPVKDTLVSFRFSGSERTAIWFKAKGVNYIPT